MAVEIRRRKVDTPLVSSEQELEQLPTVHRVIDAMTRVNAVEGLAQSIELQTRRVSKLQKQEHLLPYTLDKLTNELRLLKDMQNDVIRFQTSASVIGYLRESLEHGGIVHGALAYQAEVELRDEVQAATSRAIELLASRNERV